MKPPPKFYIKKRFNMQTGVYYVAMGSLSKTAARCHERPLYGANEMLPFDTEDAYKSALEKLRKEGAKIQ